MEVRLGAETSQRRMILYGGLLLLALCCFVSFAALVAFLSGWAPFKLRESLSASTLPLELVWTYKTQNRLSDPPWYYEDIVLIRSSIPFGESLRDVRKPDSWIDAVDAETGKRRWRFTRHSIGVRRPSWQELDAGDQLIVISYTEGAIAVLDAQDGTVEWQRGPDQVRALIATDDHLYFGGFGQMRGYDLATGVWLWETDLPGESGLELAIDGDQLYALGSKPWILDPTTGEIRAALDEPRSFATMLVSQGKIFAKGECEELGQMVAYDAKTGERLWAKPYRPENPYWYPTVVDDTLFLRTDTGSLVAVSTETGELLWEYRPSAEAQVISKVAVLDDRAYFLVSDKTLRAVDLRTGEEGGRLQSKYMRSWHDVEPGEPISVPGVAASEHMLFVSFGGRTLYAFAPTK
jgi:outer membrane protein assembly factor BamB